MATMVTLVNKVVIHTHTHTHTHGILSNFRQSWIFSNHIPKNPQHRTSQKFFGRKQSCSVRKNRLADTQRQPRQKLVIPNFANVLKDVVKHQRPARNRQLTLLCSEVLHSATTRIGVNPNCRLHFSLDSKTKINLINSHFVPPKCSSHTPRKFSAVKRNTLQVLVFCDTTPRKRYSSEGQASCSISIKAGQSVSRLHIPTSSRP